MIGATDAREAAESLAQKKPSGLEKEAIASASVPEFTVLTLMHQKDSFHARMIASRAVEAIPGRRQGQQ